MPVQRLLASVTRRGGVLRARFLTEVREYWMARALRPALRDGFGEDVPRRPIQGPPRVLFLGPALLRREIWDTRANYVMRDMLDALAGADIHWATGPLPRFARAALVELRDRYDLVHHALPAGPAERRYDDMLAASLQLARRLQPDVVSNVFGGIVFGSIAATIAPLVGARSVMRVPGDEVAARHHMGVYDAAPRGVSLAADLARQAIGLAASDRVIVMSERERRRLVDNLGPEGADERIQVCIRGIDLGRFAGRERIAPRERPPRVLYVGRNSLEKGGDLLYEVAAIVGARRPAVEFVVAGDFPSGRSGNVHAIGYVPSEALPELYDGADLFLSCSRTEGFPQAVAEALAMGLPCVLPQPVFAGTLDEASGARLAAADAPSLAAAVVDVLDTPAVYGRLSAAALAHAALAFERRSWLDRYRALMLDWPQGEQERSLASLKIPCTAAAL